MTLAERHDFIMDLLQQQGSVSVAALAERLKVSEVTIRKDLTLLEEKKMLYRAHGSAILINPYINDRPVNERRNTTPPRSVPSASAPRRSSRPTTRSSSRREPRCSSWPARSRRRGG